MTRALWPLGCIDCGFDASFQPSEIVACPSCGGRLVAAASETLEDLHDPHDALLAVFLDPLSSHGARALVRETLGIPFIPFASPEKMLSAHRETGRMREQPAAREALFSVAEARALLDLGIEHHGRYLTESEYVGILAVLNSLRDALEVIGLPAHVPRGFDPLEWWQHTACKRGEIARDALGVTAEDLIAKKWHERVEAAQ